MKKKIIESILLERAWDTINLWLRRNDLTALAKFYDTDKLGTHRYTPHYQSHLGHLKHQKFNLLEIGVGGFDDPKEGGASLRMWKAFFPRASIFSIDIFDKTALEESRIRIFRGSQADPDFLYWVAKQIGQIDVVIDDGSHVNQHVMMAFKTLFPLLPSGGIYAIEDLQTSYWPEFGGSNDPDCPHTSMAMLKQLVDGLNWEEFRNREPGPFDQHVVSLHFYHNLVFVYKGLNQEGTNKNHKHLVLS